MLQREKWQNSGITRPGKHTNSYGKSPFLMGKLTISMAIFNSYVKLLEGIENNHLVRGFTHEKW